MNIIAVPGELTNQKFADIKQAHDEHASLPHGARYASFSSDWEWTPSFEIITDAPATAKPKPVSVPDLLEGMAKTYRERNAVYGDNWRNVGNVMMALFPEGVALSTADEFNTWHLFELIVVKLTRFSNSALQHADSIHDIAVYAAMIEAALKEKAGQ